MYIGGYHGLYIREHATVHRRGVFTSKAIAFGSIVFRIRGRMVPYDPTSATEANDNLNYMGIGPGYLIEDADLRLRRLNHSCDPNMGILGACTFIARRPIAAHEELTFDYAISEESALWQLEKRCTCRTALCRGIIGGITTLPEDRFSAYLPYIPAYMQRLYRKKQKL